MIGVINFLGISNLAKASHNASIMQFRSIKMLMWQIINEEREDWSTPSIPILRAQFANHAIPKYPHLLGILAFKRFN
jgi:hypothetical protein